MNTTVSAKGQITLVSLTLADGELRLRPGSAGTARRLAGSLRRYAKPGTTKSIRARVKREVGRATAAEGASG